MYLSRDKLQAADLKAGDAVAAGALLAGPLLKRSEWLHAWNKRFCILTTEELAWLPTDRAGEWRAVTLLSTLRLVVRDNTLVLIPSSQPAQQFCFRAASEPELRMWHAQTCAILEGLQCEARLARLHLRESSARFSAPFIEVPHIGSRNHHERSLRKLFFLCRRVEESPPPTNAPSMGGAAVCMYLLALPRGATGWSGVQVLLAHNSPHASPPQLPTTASTSTTATPPHPT